MKILYYSPHPHLHIEDQAGYGTHMREMIGAFEELGHEVKFMIAGESAIQSQTSTTSLQKSSHLKQIFKAIIPSIIWETAKDLALIRLDRASGEKLAELAANFQPDVIYQRSHYGMVSGVQVAREFGIHHVLEVNSPNVDERVRLSGQSLLAQHLRTKDTWTFSHSDHVVVVSTFLAKNLRIDQIAKNWSVTPNAIRKGQELESTLEVSRESLSIESSAFLLGFVGSIFPWHGVDLIIDAVQHLQQEGKNVQALIVGDGAIRGALEEDVKTLGLSNCIQFTGAVQHRDTFAYTRLCDALVLPRSNAYGSPVKIFEYGLVGKPCIIPNVAPVNEVFKHGEDGWVADSNAEAIVTALESVIESPEKAEKCAGNWYEKVTLNHSWQTNAVVALSKLH
jgi:glycosyltransferase involved in cell wall biosynthesis